MTDGVLSDENGRLDQYTALKGTSLVLVLTFVVGENEGYIIYTHGGLQAAFCFYLAQQPQWTRISSFTRFLNHTQRPTTLGRTTLDE